MAIEGMSRKLLREVEGYLRQGAVEKVVRNAIRAAYPDMTLGTVERYLETAQAALKTQAEGRSLVMHKQSSRQFKNWQKAE